MCFRHDARELPVLIGVGGLFGIKAGNREETVAFLHAIALKTPEALFAGLEGVIKVLSADATYHLRQDLLSLATEGSDQQQLLKGVALRLDEACARSHAFLELRRARLGSVAHDCAGGPAIAWLAMAASKMNAAPSWEVFDEVTASGSMQTTCMPKIAETARASDLIERGVLNYVHSVALTGADGDEHSSGLPALPHLPAEKASALEDRPMPERASLIGRPRDWQSQTSAEGVSMSGPFMSLRNDRSFPLRQQLRGAIIVSILSLAFSIGALIMSLRTRSPIGVVGFQVSPRSADTLAAKVSQASKEASKEALEAARDARTRVDLLTIQSLVDSVAYGAVASSKLSLQEVESQWGADPRVLAVVLRRAGELRDQPMIVLRLTAILSHLQPSVLRSRRSDVDSFLSSIDGNGPRTRQAIAVVEMRMK
jgi:hypothetical protein